MNVLGDEFVTLGHGAAVVSIVRVQFRVLLCSHLATDRHVRAYRVLTPSETMSKEVQDSRRRV